MSDDNNDKANNTYTDIVSDGGMDPRNKKDEDARSTAYLYGVGEGSNRIKELEDRLIESRTRIDDLERWVAGIADDKQMPTYVQQSARSLLAQKGELSMAVPEGYAIVPIEPTKSMIDAGLGADSDAFPLKYIYQAMIEAAQEGE